MGLKEIGERLPPGYKFYPNDEELVCHYLYKKIGNEESINGTLVDIDLHSSDPWQLPEVAKLSESEWYFFAFRDRKYATGYRTNRATKSGYWKATGKDRPVFDPNTRVIVGMRKTLVFYRNRAPNGIKTCWIMHEFGLESPPMPPKEDWVLCRVFDKSNRDRSMRHIFDETMLSSNLHHIIDLPMSMPMPSLRNEQQQIPTSNYSISSSNNNNNSISILGSTNDIGNSYVIVQRNNNKYYHVNVNDNMSSSSSLNPSDHHHHHHHVGSSELMNENEDDEYGFLGHMDLLEGTSKFGGGVGYEQANGNINAFF